MIENACTDISFAVFLPVWLHPDAVFADSQGGAREHAIFLVVSRVFFSVFFAGEENGLGEHSDAEGSIDPCYRRLR